MSVARTGRAGAAVLAVLLALTLASCLYHPPGQLPSSVRILYSKATKDSLGSNTDIYFIVARDENELRLTGGEGVDTQPEFVPNALKVVFTRRSGAHDEIWVMDFDGSNEERAVAADDADVRDPAVSPDGTLLAYTRVQGGVSEIVVSALDGSDERVILSEGGPWSRADWSPDGSTLAVVGKRGDVPRMFTVPVSGGTPREVAPGDAGSQSDPDWSPDGKRIAYTHGTGGKAEIAVVEVASGTVHVLTDNDSEDRDPSWSPDGSRIAFISHRPKNHYNVWYMGSDGSDVKSLTEGEKSDAADPEWI